MATMTLEELSSKMRDIDFAMLITRTDGGEIAGRPMSNNGDVEYDGDSYYFTHEQSRTVRDIENTPEVSLAFQGNTGVLGQPGMMIAVQGGAELIRDKAQFEPHWTSDLDRWFEQGIDTPGVVLIKVSAKRIRYWNGEDDGELVL